MKILVVGDWHSELHEEAVFGAFKKLGHDVFRFAWHQYFQFNENSCLSWISRIYHKVQNKYLFGPILGKINSDLIKKVRDVHPDFIFVYRGTHIFPSTLKRIKSIYPNIILAGYNNDDPFSKHYGFTLWRHFLSGVPEYDIVFAYRKHNIEEYKAIGAEIVFLLRSWYMPERNYPVLLSADEKEEYGCDVVFVGHYEDDGRVALLEAIVESGYNLKIFGPGKYWDSEIQKSSQLRHLLPIKMVWGENYNKALCGAKVALCFFSRLNRDTYTRRCFEVPATNTLLLSEYSDDLAELYCSNKEIIFFKSEDALLSKLQLYVEDESLREAVADAGYRRVCMDGHDVVSRMKQVILWVETLKK